MKVGGKEARSVPPAGEDNPAYDDPVETPIDPPIETPIEATTEETSSGALLIADVTADDTHNYSAFPEQEDSLLDEDCPTELFAVSSSTDSEDRRAVRKMNLNGNKSF